MKANATRIAAGAIAVLIPGIARATTCMILHQPLIPDGATEVPRNIQPMVQHDVGTHLTVRLLGEGGVEIPIDVTHHPTHTVVVPVALLPAGQSFALDDGFGIRTFTTGDTIDTTPPWPPILEAISRPLSNLDLSDSYPVPYWAIEDDQLRIDVRSLDGSYLETDVATTDDFSDAIRFGSQYPTQFIGHDRCGDTLASFDIDTTYVLRLRSVDWAGNASPWQQLRSPPPRLGPAVPQPWLPLVAGFAGVLGVSFFLPRQRSPARRRRRRRRS